jgi:hypothetical protein
MEYTKMKKDVVQSIARLYHPLLGVYYASLHLLLMGGAAFLLLFNQNILHLFLLLCIVAIDALSCVILHNCPLTILEQKYLGTSLIRINIETCKKMKIGYRHSHEYERTIELLCNVGALLILKIVVLMIRGKI